MFDARCACAWDLFANFPPTNPHCQPAAPNQYRRTREEDSIAMFKPPEKLSLLERIKSRFRGFS
jgi:hypothetical protein